MSRRFIAGAVCPRCGLMDKLFLSPNDDAIECIRCGHRESRPAKPNRASGKPITIPATLPAKPNPAPETPPEKIRFVGEEPPAC